MIDAEKTITRARRRLGAPLINVELADEQMTSLLKEAHETFYLFADISGMGWEEKDKVEDAWIRKYFYALCKETLGRVRENAASLLPGVNLNDSYKTLLAESDKEKTFLKYIIFKEKELLPWAKVDNAVLVFYIYVGNLNTQDSEALIFKIKNRASLPNGFTAYYVPVRSGDSRVECIYPVSTKLDEKEEHVIDRLNSYLKDSTSDLLNNEEDKDE